MKDEKVLAGELDRHHLILLAPFTKSVATLMRSLHLNSRNLARQFEGSRIENHVEQRTHALLDGFCLSLDITASTDPWLLI